MSNWSNFSRITARDLVGFLVMAAMAIFVGWIAARMAESPGYWEGRSSGPAEYSYASGIEMAYTAMRRAQQQAVTLELENADLRRRLGEVERQLSTLHQAGEKLKEANLKLEVIEKRLARYHADQVEGRR